MWIVLLKLSLRVLISKGNMSFNCCLERYKIISKRELDGAGKDGKSAPAAGTKINIAPPAEEPSKRGCC